MALLWASTGLYGGIAPGHPPDGLYDNPNTRE
nr:MAG TPA: hypothetical protein [Caudoviricetes sp.]